MIKSWICFRVNLQVSFGKDENVRTFKLYFLSHFQCIAYRVTPQFWTNVFPTQLVERHAREISRFKWAIKFMRWFELLFMLIPIKVTLKMFFFSDE